MNSDLIGKVVNIASRCAGFLRKKFDNRMSTECAEPELVQSFIDAGEHVAALYEAREFNRAMREIITLADRANQYIDEKKPWVMAKDETLTDEVQNVCSVGVNLFRVLATYLKPVLPAMAEKSEAFYSTPSTGPHCRRRSSITNWRRFSPFYSGLTPRSSPPWWKPAKAAPEPTNTSCHTPDIFPNIAALSRYQVAAGG